MSMAIGGYVDDAAAATPPLNGLGEALERLLRPAIGFTDPADVLKDPLLTPSEKRAVLSSWASDACAVRGRPHLRWPLGAPAPAPVGEVLEALARLDRLEARPN